MFRLTFGAVALGVTSDADNLVAAILDEITTDR